MASQDIERKLEQLAARARELESAAPLNAKQKIARNEALSTLEREYHELAKIRAQAWKQEQQ